MSKPKRASKSKSKSPTPPTPAADGHTGLHAPGCEGDRGTCRCGRGGRYVPPAEEL